LFFNTFQKVINGGGCLDDLYGLSPILCDIVTLFVYTSYVPPKWLTEPKRYVAILARAAHWKTYLWGPHIEWLALC